MRLADILDKLAEALGLYLEEDKDFVYLKKGEEVLEVWYANAASNDEIERTVRSWIVVYRRRGGNLQHSLPME